MDKDLGWGIRRGLFRGIRFAAFAAVFLIMVYAINRCLSNTLQYNGTLAGFYQMEENTVDVILLGSSHIGTGINPQDMYDEAGIRSYNLSTYQQPLWISYYWLKEALQYQSPSVVVLECYELFYNLSSVEMSSRWGLDEMRAGPVKSEAVRTVCELNESLHYFSYFLSNIRYHERWDMLTENDFIWMEENSFHQSKGFFKEWDICMDETFTPISSLEASEAEPEQFDAAEEEYLDKIVALCEEKDIELILIKTPSVSQTPERHAAIQAYADYHDLIFYDFNIAELYEEIDFDYAYDMSDSNHTGDSNCHANPSGARKMSQYLAERLSRMGVRAVVDSQWEESRTFNEHIWQNFLLANEESMDAFLDSLSENRYTVFVLFKNTGETVSEQVTESMLNLGFTVDLNDMGTTVYAAVRDNGGVIETTGNYLDLQGTVRNGRVIYELTADIEVTGSTGTIRIDDTSYSQSQEGLYFVIYDNEIRMVVAERCFDIRS